MCLVPSSASKLCSQCLSAYFLFSSRRRHTSCALVTGVQTCALPIILREHLDAALVGVSRWRCLPGFEDPARLVRLHAEHPHQHRVAAAVDVEKGRGDRVAPAWPAEAAYELRVDLRRIGELPLLDPVAMTLQHLATLTAAVHG